MKTLEIIALVIKELPKLVRLAEGLFGWKRKSGLDKKAFVTDGIKTVVNEIDAHSAGGQKKTWDILAPLISSVTDEVAASIFPPSAGPDASPAVRND